MTKTRPSKVGYVALALVIVGCAAIPTCFGVLLLGYGVFLAFAMILFDARDARPVSRPAIVALLLGLSYILLTSAAWP